MARKTIADLRTPPGVTDRHDKSWAALGWDTSMTSIAVVGIGYDAVLDKHVGPAWAETRWMPEDDYFLRLGQAARAEKLALDVLNTLWVIKPERVWHAFEEPFHYGAVQRQIGSWVKQQAEVSGAVKGAIVRYGFKNLNEINNSQWHAALRKDGVEFDKVPRGIPQGQKDAIKLANKFKVKTWAMERLGLPDFPDLVASKSGAKIPRPESGFGAKARAVQPSDIYDAAAIAHWMRLELESAILPR